MRKTSTGTEDETVWSDKRKRQFGLIRGKDPIRQRE